MLEPLENNTADLGSQEQKEIHFLSAYFSVFCIHLKTTASPLLS